VIQQAGTSGIKPTKPILQNNSFKALREDEEITSPRDYFLSKTSY